MEGNYLSAKPIKATIKFITTSEAIQQVTGTDPLNGSNNIQRAFQTFASLAGNSGYTLLADAFLAISTLPGNTVTVSGKNATFKPSLNNLSSMDLPSGTTASNAKYNTKGATFITIYRQHASYSAARVKSTGVLTYKVFLNTDHTINLNTGTLNVEHNVDLN